MRIYYHVIPNSFILSEEKGQGGEIVIFRENIQILNKLRL